ncbi:uncharacterized protein CIMG_13505 [Coccidioides immitis RS]|uniref:Uncharacterized protein n=1 Tax=Coccidioides immitis (strain RS) TaxID=246410 RepID=A0A0D8JWB4_COCIM|nr:uncharacterized protein CIMG_13505 [Coccidioides immitis RS]KJF61216.1 hypothetical protein CIMG_13505 [Coccidioides immitis RS]
MPQGHAQINHILGDLSIVNVPDVSEVMAKAYKIIDVNQFKIEQGTAEFIVASF